MLQLLQYLHLASLNIDILSKFHIYNNSDICDGSVSTYYSSSGGILEWEVLNGTIQSPAGPPYIASQIDVIWDQGYGTGVVKVSPTNTGFYCNGIATQSVNIIETPQDPIDIVNDVLQSDESNLLIVVYNNQNQRRYLGVKIK